MTRSFGGFLGLEATPFNMNKPYHDADLVFNTARACLSYTIKQRQVRKIHIPYYICEAVIDAIKCHDIEYRFYHIDNRLEINDAKLNLTGRDLLLYVNYFGLKNHYISSLEKKHRHQLLIDNSQAFYQKKYQYSWSFNSARKFFGVTDGAYLYTPNHRPPPEKKWPLADFDNTYLQQKKNGLQQKAYQGFVKHEQQLTTHIMTISNFSHRILNRVDYKKSAELRRRNFCHLHKHLSQYNQLILGTLCHDEVPLYYPFVYTKAIRDQLIEQQLFIPHLWKPINDHSHQNYPWEHYLSKNLLALPIDQRYPEDDMQQILTIVFKYL